MEANVLRWRRETSLLWSGAGEGDALCLRLLVRKRTCLLTWTETLSLASRGAFAIQTPLRRLPAPFAQPVQTGEVFMEKCLLSRALRSQRRGSDVQTAGRVSHHSPHLCPRQTSPINWFSASRPPAVSTVLVISSITLVCKIAFFIFSLLFHFSPFVNPCCIYV